MTPAEAFQLGLEAGQKIAALQRDLNRALHQRQQLEYPLSIIIQDEPRKERRATPEEVQSWKTTADVTVQRLKDEIAQLKRFPQP